MSDSLATDLEQVAAVSQRLLYHMREIARQDGWALAVHGSLSRDLDVIAVPWTKEATDEAAFVEAMRAAVARELNGAAFIGAGNDRRNPGHEDKPHGRRCWTIHGLSDQLVKSEHGVHPYVDLAVMDFRLSPPIEHPISDRVCEVCQGEGKVEHPHLSQSYSGIASECPSDPILVKCEDCDGTGNLSLAEGNLP